MCCCCVTVLLAVHQCLEPFRPSPFLYWLCGSQNITTWLLPVLRLSDCRVAGLLRCWAEQLGNCCSLTFIHNLTKCHKECRDSHEWGNLLLNLVWSPTFIYSVHSFIWVMHDIVEPWIRFKLILTRNTFCGIWYLPHSQVHNDQAVPIIMVGCIVHLRNGHISTSTLKSDVTIMFLDPHLL